MDDIAGKTEVMNEAATKTKPKPRQSAKPFDAPMAKSIPDVAAYLSKNGITRLFHFTDVSNLSSIRKTGLMSAACLIENAIPAKMNSDALSRDLDKARGLQDYVRLSFNDQNPMKYVARTQKRVSKPVMLQIMLEVVTKPGVLFSDCNATRKGCRDVAEPCCSALEYSESEKSVRGGCEGASFLSSGSPRTVACAS